MPTASHRTTLFGARITSPLHPRDVTESYNACCARTHWEPKARANFRHHHYHQHHHCHCHYYMAMTWDCTFCKLWISSCICPWLAGKITCSHSRHDDLVAVTATAPRTIHAELLQHDPERPAQLALPRAHVRQLARLARHEIQHLSLIHI